MRQTQVRFRGRRGCAAAARASRACLAVFLASLVASAPGASRADDAWTERRTVEFPTGNLSLSAAWTATNGLRVKVIPVGGAEEVLLTLRRAGCRVDCLPAGAFPSNVVEGARFFPAHLPTNQTGTVRLTLKFRLEMWCVYVDNRPVALIPTPFLPPAKVFQPAGEIAKDNVHLSFQKALDFTFRDDFLVPESENRQLAGWEVDSGTWQLHSAADSATERGILPPGAQRRPDAEHSANFYSLKGRGTNAIITAGHFFYDTYSAESAVLVEPGEQGMVFYFQDASDYFAFTLCKTDGRHEVVAWLWRVNPRTGRERRILAAARTRVTDGQWVRLGVEVAQERVRCFLDTVPLLDVATELGAGGRFGLFVNGNKAVRFDDVAARSSHDLRFDSPVNLRRFLLQDRGLIASGQTGFEPAPDDRSLALAVRPGSEPRWAMLGAPLHGPHVFAADFEPGPAPWTVGLLAGCVKADGPHLRFVCVRSATNEVLALERVTENRAEGLERVELPVGPGRPSGKVRLMCDASEPDTFRLYRDGDMVLVRHGRDAPRGASGLYLGPGTGARISDLDYRFTRTGLYRNQFEKNRAFITDPFMRHWSSPEGQWITCTNGLTWYKGDFFGPFLVRMPFIVGSRIELGVPERATNGPVRVLARPDGLALLAANANLPGGSDREVARADADQLLFCTFEDAYSDPVSNLPASARTQRLKWYTLQCEGYWLWVKSADQVLFRHRLAEPLRGSRIRIAGFTDEQLKFSYVERFAVKDFLFKESLHEWTRNGGNWEVVNRFQCLPTWSHMNGESKDGLAALWTKYVYGGDFCVEMYAGIRHGWYERCGDLNLTVMNRDTTPSQGYTVTCTGWDPDHSQLFTRLYRNGEKVVESDKYLVPRFREGNKRRGYTPLVHEGRDVHGAWYYIKFRRIGKRLEYEFDNEPVLSFEDDQPIDAGSLGVWTYMNSMVVARVKIAAQSIRPRMFSFAPLTPDAALNLVSESRRPPPDPSGIRAGDGPLELVRPDRWSIDDPVGQSRMLWRQGADGQLSLSVSNVLGGGTLFAESRLPAVPCSELAGWRLRLRRTPCARFNIHYSIGRRTGDKFVAAQNFFHRVSGTDFSRGSYRMSGETPVPGSPAGAADWAADSGWTEVEVWVPPDVLQANAAADAYVRLEGIGNGQPSFESQGLTGNGPGEGYAVKGLTEIRYAPPVLGWNPATRPADAWRLTDRATGVERAHGASAADLQAWMDGANGLTRARLRVAARTDAGTVEGDLDWIRPPAALPLACGWDGATPAAILVSCDLPYPERRFASARYRLDGVETPAEHVGMNRRRLRAPRFERDVSATNSTVSVVCGGTTQEFTLAWAGRPVEDAPALVRLAGMAAFVANFESGPLGTGLLAAPGQTRVEHSDPVQGQYLAVLNRPEGRRLRVDFQTAIPLAQFPVAQFRYRAEPAAQISLALNNAHFVRLSEEYAAARSVTNTLPFVRDGTWRTWHGTVSDAVTDAPIRSGMYDIRAVGFGSFHAVDQTGLFSQWNLDDVVFGPALSSNAPPSFAATYFDHDGVDRVLYAVAAGPRSYHELSSEAIRGLGWREADNGGKVTLDLAFAGDGYGHLFIKARDRRGVESPVTDVPFLLDSTPIVTSHSFEESSEPYHNGSVLRVTFRTGLGAPMDPREWKVKWFDTEVPTDPAGSRFWHGKGEDDVILNWPYVFRDPLNRTTNGQIYCMVFSGIRDGAGNLSADLTVTGRVDYASDRTVPTLLPTDYPSNVFWCTRLESPPSLGAADPAPDRALPLRRRPRPFRRGAPPVAENREYFQATMGESVALIRDQGGEDFLRVENRRESGAIQHAFVAAPWDMASHPYLAFRVRRPDLRPTDKTRIELALFLNRKECYVVPLTHDLGEKDVIHPPQPLVWRSNVWHTVVLDVGGLLRARFAAEARGRGETAEAASMMDDDMAAKLVTARLRGVRISELHVRQSGARVGGLLDLQSVFIFSPWGAADRVALRAFDVSGVAGATWEYEPAGIVTRFAADGTAQESEAGWMAMRAQDNAGNLSRPVRIPVLGRPAAGREVAMRE